MDEPDAAEKLKAFRQRFREKVEIIPISARESEGLEALQERLSELVAPAAGAEPGSEEG